MKNDRLKPHVHKIKGAKHYAFYDMLTGKLYHMTPEGDLESVRKQLDEAGLIFQPQGTVPFKTRLNIPKKEGNILLRKLQVRLNGNSGGTCWNRKTTSPPPEPMSIKTIDAITANIKSIPVDTVIIEAKHWDNEAVSALIKNCDPSSVRLVIQEGVNRNDLENLRKYSGADIQFYAPGKEDIAKLNVDAFDFFYHQVYNPCHGHQAAIDSRGEIKPCLWSREVLGNIHHDCLNHVIISGAFDRYWELTKDSIGTCGQCEYRYNCNDCRIIPASGGDYTMTKPVFCTYDPYN